MKNANVLSIRAIRFFKTEDRAKWARWYEASFSPLLMSTGNIIGTDWFDQNKGNVEISPHMTFWYMENIENYLDYNRSVERNAYLKDLDKTWGGKYEDVWSAVYLLAKRMTQTPELRPIGKTTEVSPVVHIEGLDLPPDGWDRYHLWLYEWGYAYYLPLILKLPGVNEFSRWLFYNVRAAGFPSPMSPEERAKYPADLSIFYLDNLESLRNFEDSRELSLYRKALKSEFPGLSNKWEITYSLYKSWRA